MSEPIKSPIGLTKDSGWQIGLRRTLSIPAEILWEFLLSPTGIETWLGKGDPFEFQAGIKYLLDDGTKGEIKVFLPGSHWRITRLPPDKTYSKPSTIQIRIMPKDNRCVLAFHEEHLPDEVSRISRKIHFLAVIENLKDYLNLN